MYHHKTARHNITGKTLTVKSHKPQLSHNCANTRAHLEQVKPRPRVTNSRTTVSGIARVGKETTPSHGNGLLTDQASIQPGQQNTITTSHPRSHGRKVQLPLHENKSNNCGDQPTPHLQTHSCRPMPGTSRVSGRSTLK
ncbi:hypothetical protein Taro_012682 [Colocasia esculenta]|uniref:Uncharacterized protein n=1 Tax=Colocasia esculenta TaxID=4460 RepID=A0A843U4L4_COLES|nr:hypothetical protein [Colocasia esculenta]